MIISVHFNHEASLVMSNVGKLIIHCIAMLIHAFLLRNYISCLYKVTVDTRFI